MIPQVILSHPGRQHSHQTALALQEARMLQKYIVPLWYKPDRFPYSMLGFGPLKTEFLKRYFAPLDQDLIAQIPQYELARRISHLFSGSECMKHIYWMNAKFDSSVAGRMRSGRFDIFIGGETAALQSFQACRKHGKVAVLDLAQAHHRSHTVLQASGFDPFDGDRELQQKIADRKDREIALADFTLTPSSVARKTITDAGVPEGKIITIPYGYDSDFFTRKNEYLKSEPFRILFVGAITKRKGIETLLQAFSELRLPRAELIFAGGKADASSLIATNGNVRCVGFANPTQLRRLYQEADLFVLPSLLDSFGLVVLEAMGCGTPVIVSEMTGARDVVREGIDGFVVPVLDVERLKEKISYLYENRDEVERMGREASRQAQNFTWARYREQVREAIVNARAARL